MEAPERGGRSRHDRHDAIGEQDGLLDVVGDHHRRDRPLGARAQLREVLLQRVACERVERAERLVEEEYARLGGERAGDRHPLPHPTRELARLAVERIAEADAIERPAGPALLIGGALGRKGRLHGQAHVLERAEPGEQRVVLEDERRVAAHARHRRAVEHDRAGVGRRQARQQAQERRLAAAHRPDDRDEFAVIDVECHVPEHVTDAGGRRERLREAADFEKRHARPPTMPAAGLRPCPSAGRVRIRRRRW